MDATIRVLRDPHKYGLAIAVLSHIATKLKTVLGATNGTVTIGLKDGTSVYVTPDHVTEIAMSPCAVHFLSEGKHLKLYLDGSSPELSEEVQIEGVGESLWRRCDLA